jgi:hypothetical protein
MKVTFVDTFLTKPISNLLSALFALWSNRSHRDVKIAESHIRPSSRVEEFTNSRIESSLKVSSTQAEINAELVPRWYGRMYTIYEKNLTKLSDLAFHLDGVQSLEFSTPPIENRCHDHVAWEKTYNGFIVDSWMTQCSDSHRGCQPSSTWHPRRLLDVGTLKKPELKLRVMSQYQWGEGSRYFTLSHRWPLSPNIMYHFERKQC